MTNTFRTLPFLCLSILIFFLCYFHTVVEGNSCFAGTLSVVKAKHNQAESIKNPSYKNSFSSYSLPELKMFGVVLIPRNAYIQDSYRGIKFLASPKSKYTKKQLELLKSFIDRTPPALLEPGPSAIVTYGHGEVNLPPGTSPLSLAMASGPYVFFNSSAFNTKGIFSAGSIEGVFRAFVHELVHVLQFHKAASSIDRKKALDLFNENGLQTIWNNAALKTSLVKSFVDITGWRLKKTPYSTVARLDDFKQEKTSSYGKASVLEDMAETVSLVTIGDLTELSNGRINWAVSLLGFPSLKTALYGTFPYSTLYKPVKLHGASVIRFDRSKKRMFRKKYPFVDLEYFVNTQKGSYPKIIRHMQKAFIQRGWNERYSKTVNLSHGVIKRVMAFDGKWRDIYLEIITYDLAKDYILKPSGTIVTVLSGYKNH